MYSLIVISFQHFLSCVTQFSTINVEYSSNQEKKFFEMVERMLGSEHQAHHILDVHGMWKHVDRLDCDDAILA